MMNDELGGYAAGLPEDFPQTPQILQRSLPVATLLASTGSPHRLTAPRYGLSSYCGRSLFIADAMALRAPR